MSTLTGFVTITIIGADGHNLGSALIPTNTLGIPVAKYCEMLAAVEYAATARIEEGDL